MDLVIVESLLELNVQLDDLEFVEDVVEEWGLEVVFFFDEFGFGLVDYLLMSENFESS